MGEILKLRPKTAARNAKQLVFVISRPILHVKIILKYIQKVRFEPVRTQFSKF